MSKHTYKKKKVKINYARFILSMLIILGVIAGIVFLVQKCADYFPVKFEVKYPNATLSFAACKKETINTANNGNSKKDSIM